MGSHADITIAVVDFGLGNLFSIRQACAFAGMEARISSELAVLEATDALLLPGVGSFGQAMAELRKLDLVHFLQDYAAASKPLVGICLGMQLLMDASEEFGHHAGLGIIPGAVRKFDQPVDESDRLKVPQMGWNTICRSGENNASAGSQWDRSPLAGLPDQTFMYFVHSYYVVPAAAATVAAYTTYGGSIYCSSLLHGNIFACQFHPERSGPNGLEIYRNMADWIKKRQE
jgi:imidazole glycerol-phosphate synthase subunit HisH